MPHGLAGGQQGQHRQERQSPGEPPRIPGSFLGLLNLALNFLTRIPRLTLDFKKPALRVGGLSLRFHNPVLRLTRLNAGRLQLALHLYEFAVIARTLIVFFFKLTLEALRLSDLVSSRLQLILHFQDFAFGSERPVMGLLPLSVRGPGLILKFLNLTFGLQQWILAVPSGAASPLGLARGMRQLTGLMAGLLQLALNFTGESLCFQYFIFCCASPFAGLLQLGLGVPNLVL